MSTLHSLHEKSTSLLKYFKDEISKMIETHENALKLVSELERVTGADEEKAVKVKTDILEMIKVLEYNITSCQSLCRYFAVIDTCIGRIMRSSDTTKRGGSKGPKGHHKYNPDPNSQRTQYALERNKQKYLATRGLASRHQPRPQQPVYDGPPTSTGNLNVGKLGFALVLTAFAALIPPVDATPFSSVRDATTNALTAATTTVASETGAAVQALKLAVTATTNGYGDALTRGETRTGTLPSDPFAHAGVAAAGNIVIPEVVGEATNSLKTTVSQSLADTYNQILLQKLINTRNETGTIPEGTESIAVIFKTVSALQVAVGLSSNGGSENLFAKQNGHTYKDSVLGPLKKSATTLTNSQVAFLNDVISTGNAKVLGSIHNRLVNMYGHQFTDVEQLKNIELASSQVSMLADNSGIGAIKFVSQYSKLLKGILSDGQIDKLTDFYSKLNQMEIEMKQNIATTQEAIKTLKKNIEDYNNSWTRVTAPFTSAEIESKKKELADLTDKLNKLTNDPYPADKIKGEFDALLNEDDMMTNKDMLRKHLVDESKRSNVNFNLLFMAICSRGHSPLGALIESVGGPLTTIGSLLANMFPTDPMVLATLTQKYDHISDKGDMCINRCQSKGATAPFCQTSCLSQADRAVHDIIGRAEGLTAFIYTIGEIAKTIKLYSGAKIAALTGTTASSQSFDTWKELVVSAASGFPGPGKGKAADRDVNRITHLATLDTLLSSTMLSSLARNENANFDNMLTYVSSLISFPSKTAGCMIAQEYLRKYGGAWTPYKGAKELTQELTWAEWGGLQYFDPTGTLASSVNTKAVLTDLAEACFSFIADAQRVTVFKNVIFDCARSGTLSTCSVNVVQQLTDARGANALLDLAYKLDTNFHSSPPKEVGWLMGKLGELGGFFGTFSVLMGSLRMIILIAILVFLTILTVKFSFMKSMISSTLGLMKHLTVTPAKALVGYTARGVDNLRGKLTGSVVNAVNAFRNLKERRAAAAVAAAASSPPPHTSHSHSTSRSTPTLPPSHSHSHSPSHSTPTLPPVDSDAPPPPPPPYAPSHAPPPRSPSNDDDDDDDDFFNKDDNGNGPPRLPSPPAGPEGGSCKRGAKKTKKLKRVVRRKTSKSPMPTSKKLKAIYASGRGARKSRTTRRISNRRTRHRVFRD